MDSFEEVEEKPETRKRARDAYRDAPYKQFRLVIRNLPWTTKVEDLQNVCSKFGTFSEIVLPPSKRVAEKPGTCAGFGFVQFKTKEAAEKARDHFNNNKFLGRSVAADWALPKDTFVTMQHEEKEMLSKKVKLEKDESFGSSSKAITNQKSPVKMEIDEDQEKESDSDNSEMEDEESGSEGSVNEQDDEHVESEESKKKTKGKKQPQGKQQSKNDKAIEEERVVFLRGLSFDTTNEALKEAMTQFGQVQLALVCVFKENGHPKGTGFVHFSTPAEAKACIKRSEDRELIIDGQTVTATLAVPREKAVELEKEKLKKIPKDNRNLRLLRFGIIREGTEAAKGMSEEDAAKRRQLTLTAKKKLENLTMFVSPLRLVIHNLSQKCDDARLKFISQQAAGAKAEITECRVWRDKDRLDKEGNAKSAGFGFVAFSEHTDALNCLLKLNNNPATFTRDKRPIVEFAIEDLRALQLKEKRLAKSKGVEVPVKALSDKIKQQVRESIGQMHSAGMKWMPKFVGKKTRHRQLTGRKKKLLEAKKKAKAAKHGKPLPPPQQKKKKTAKEIKKPTKAEENRQIKKRNKKSVTKYLTLSG